MARRSNSRAVKPWPTRTAVRRRRLTLELLERRVPLAADLAITDAFLVDRFNNPIAAPVEGELAFVRAEWRTTDLNSSQQYVVHYEMDGITVASATLTGQAGTNLGYNWYRGVAFSAPGTRQMRGVIDGGDQILESDENNNEIIFNFTPAQTDFPEQMIFPIGGEPYKDWSVVNYTDVNINGGIQQDFRGGPFQYDGHDAFDITLPNFQRMDDGIPILAAAGGTVVDAVDGNFDRETSANSRPANYVAIDHGNGWVAYYFHLQRETVAVEVGQTVARGQMIGLTGSSGSSTDAHLHFSLYRNGSVVEPMYKPEDYFIQPPAYQGDLPPTITASGITDRAPWDEFKEIPNDIRQFRSDSSTDTWFWYRLSHLNDGESLAIEWYRPDGTLDATYNWTANGVARYHGHGWIRNTRSHEGLWTVVLKHAGAELTRETFEVVGSGGSPELDVRNGSTYVIDGRSTPIDFGSAPVGGAAITRTFTLSNWGTQDLTITSVDPPRGFQVVTSPTTIAPGGSDLLVVELTATQVGEKWGDLTLHTNDPDESQFRFGIEGSVTGTPLPGAATLQQNLPALAVENHLPQAVFPIVTIGNVTGLGLADGTLVAEIVSGQTATDRLQFLSPDVNVNQGQVFYQGTHVADVVADGATGVLSLDLLSTTSVTAITELARSIHFVDESNTPAARRRLIDLHVADSTGVTSNTLRRGASYLDQLPDALLQFEINLPGGGTSTGPTVTLGEQQTVSVTVSAIGAPTDILSHQLNFENSSIAAGQLVLDNWSRGASFSLDIDNTLSTPGDPVVAAGNLSSIPVPVVLGTFDLTTPDVAGTSNFLLTVDSVTGANDDTILSDAAGQPLPITKFGDLQITVEDTPASVTGVVINGGLVDPPDLAGKGPQPTDFATQRSELRSIVVSFSEPMATINPADLVLTNLGVNAPADADVVVPVQPSWLSQTSESGNTLTLSFSNSDLAEGVYRLEILPTATDLAGNALDGDGNGTGGDPFGVSGSLSNGLFELTGDFNGNGGVNVLDFATYAYWFNQDLPDAPGYVDGNDSGGVNILDFAPFAANFNRTITEPLGPVGGRDSRDATEPVVQPVEDFLTDAVIDTPADIGDSGGTADARDIAFANPALVRSIRDDADIVDPESKWDDEYFPAQGDAASDADADPGRSEEDRSAMIPAYGEPSAQESDDDAVDEVEAFVDRDDYFARLEGRLSPT